MPFGKAEKRMHEISLKHNLDVNGLFAEEYRTRHRPAAERFFIDVLGELALVLPVKEDIIRLASAHLENAHFDFDFKPQKHVSRTIREFYDRASKNGWTELLRDFVLAVHTLHSVFSEEEQKTALARLVELVNKNMIETRNKGVALRK